MNTTNEIENRKDLEILVNRFYAKIRQDEMLGAIFNSQIPEDHWPAHLSKLTDFWETTLFGVPKFKGRPTSAHIRVDANLGHNIESKHFGYWMQFWFETLDELYTGELAEKAKQAARKMSTGQFLAIWNSRPKK